MAASANAAGVAKHYARGGALLQRLKEALLGAGLDVAKVSSADLDPVDEFHLGGRATAEKLFDLLAPEEGASVLDVGSGLGGPARLLAERKIHVVGIDLTPAYVEAANAMTSWPGVGLADRCEFKVGDALCVGGCGGGRGEWFALRAFVANLCGRDVTDPHLI